MPTNETTLAKYLERPVSVGSFTVSVGGVTLVQGPSIFDSFWQSSTVVNKVRGYAGMRGDPEVTVYYQGSPFVYGTAILWFFPISGVTNNLFGSEQFWPSILDTPDNVDPCYAMQLPHIKINFEESTTHTISLPCPSAQRYMEFNPTYSNDWKWGVTVLNSLVSINDSTPESINFQVYAGYKDVKLFNPGLVDNSSLFAKTIEIVPEGDTRDYKNKKVVKSSKKENGQPISSALGYVAQAMEAVSPVLPIVTPWARIASLGSDLARALGFSRPPIIETNAITPYCATNFSHVGGSNDFSFRLAMDPRSAMDTGAGRIPIGDDDDMLINTIVRKWGYVATIEVGTSAGDFTWVYALPYVNRVASNVSDAIVYHTPLSFGCLSFAYWTGSLEFEFEFLGNSFCRSTVGMVIVPTGAYVPSSFYTEEAESCIRSTCQVVGRTLCHVEVPYSGRNVFTSTTSITNSKTNTIQYNGLALGGAPRVFIFVLSPITLNTGVTIPIKANVYVRGGKNFEYAIPALGNSSNLLAYTASSICPEGDDRDGTMAQEIFGEQISSINELFKRSAQMYYGTTTSAATNSNYYPFFGVYPGYSTNTTNSWTYVTLWSRCFLGARGGMRYKWMWPTQTAAIPIFAGLGIFGAPSVTTLPVTTPSGAVDFSTSRGGQPMSLRGRDCYEIEIPHRETAYYREAWRMGGYVPGGHTGIGEAFRIITNTASVPFTLYQSGADDYTVYGFLGVQPMKVL